MNAARLRVPVFLTMETLWLYAGIALLVAGAEPPEAPSLLAVAAALAGGYGAAWFAADLDVSERTARAVGLGIGLATLAAVLRLAYAGDLAVWRLGVAGDLLTSPGDTYDTHPGGVTSGLALAGVWVRGTWLAQDPQAAGMGATRSFAVGLAVVGLGVALADAAGTGAARHVALPFGALGFAAIALGQAGQWPLSGGATPRWFIGVLGGGIAVALMAAALLALLPWEATRDPLAAAGEGVLWTVGWLLIITLTPVFFVIEWLLRGLLAMLDALGIDGAERDVNLDTLRDAARDEQRSDSPFPDWFAPALRYGALGLVVLTALWAASLLFLRRSANDEIAPQRVSLWGTARTGERRSWFDRFRRVPADRPGAGAIGRLYGELLDHAARQGLPRPPSLTPHEFAPRIVERFELPIAIDISEAFARARYGGLPPGEGMVRELRAALHRGLTTRATL